MQGFSQCGKRRSRLGSSAASRQRTISALTSISSSRTNVAMRLGGFLRSKSRLASLDFAHSTEGGWWFYIDEKHENYWLGHSLPVVLALHDDRDGNTFWVRVAPETIERTRNGGSKILVPSSQVLDKAAFDRVSVFAARRVAATTGAFQDSPNRHRVVMREAMQGAARDDARIAFELSHR